MGYIDALNAKMSPLNFAMVSCVGIEEYVDLTLGVWSNTNDNVDLVSSHEGRFVE